VSDVSRGRSRGSLHIPGKKDISEIRKFGPVGRRKGSKRGPLGRKGEILRPGKKRPDLYSKKENVWGREKLGAQINTR